MISLNRPSSAEASAGKNPVGHVGKLYNILSFRLAEKIVSETSGVTEAVVWLGSQIGEPVDRPALVAVQVRLARGAAVADVRDRIDSIVTAGLIHLGELSDQIIDGLVTIY